MNLSGIGHDQIHDSCAANKGMSQKNKLSFFLQISETSGVINFDETSVLSQNLLINAWENAKINCSFNNPKTIKKSDNYFR